MTHNYWPVGATLVADVFNACLVASFPEIENFLEWTDWSQAVDERYSERIPPFSVIESWETRLEYPAAKQVFHQGIPVAGVLSEAQWRLYDVVTSEKIYPQVLDLNSNQLIKLSGSVLRPSQRPQLGCGVWFDNILPRSVDDLGGGVAIGAVHFDRADADQLKTALDKRWQFVAPIELSSGNLGKAQERARYALRCLFGRTDRPAGASQEATHAQVNEFLSKRHLPTVSESTVRRALGERT